MPSICSVRFRWNSLWASVFPKELLFVCVNCICYNLYGKRNIQSFVDFSIAFCVQTALQSWRSMSSNCFLFQISGGILSRLAVFFFNTASTSSYITCFRLKLGYSSRVFVGFVCGFTSVFEQILEMFFPLWRSIFLVDIF